MSPSIRQSLLLGAGLFLGPCDESLALAPVESAIRNRQDHHRAEGRSSTVGPAVGDRGGQSLAHDAEECGNSSPLLGDQCAHPVGRSHRLGIQHPELAHFPPGPASAAVFVRVSVARQFSMLTTLCPMRNVGELCAMEANPWWRKQRR